MLIIADENIPYVREAFGALGEVRTLPGRRITPEALRGAEALLVRSVTPVGAQLLEGSTIRFVGTATAGFDHVDTDCLARRGIGFASASGSNAESVAQYVAAVLLHLRSRLGGSLRGPSIGIVGVGHCGSRVERIARALAMEPVLCDPPLARRSGEARYRPLAELAGCDVVTLHVPLIDSGPDATAGMIGAEFLAAMKPGAALINAARGVVVDEAALLATLVAGRLAGAAIDCWAAEPSISLDLQRHAMIATPHIAGYSLDGKLRGTEMIHRALCEFLGVAPQWSAAGVLPRTVLTLEPAVGGEPEARIARLVEESYPLMRDDAALRRMLTLRPPERAEFFDSLRRDYPIRREFAATRITLRNPESDLGRRLLGLGFDAVCEEGD